MQPMMVVLCSEGNNAKSAADLFSAYRSGAGVDGIAGAEVTKLTPNRAVSQDQSSQQLNSLW